MKQKISIGWLLLLGLVLMSGAVGLGGCGHDDDDFENGVYKGDVYQGCVVAIEMWHNTDNIREAFIVEVTDSPRKGSSGKEWMPRKNDLLRVTGFYKYDFIDDLKIGTKLSFSIEYATVDQFQPSFDEEPCKWEDVILDILEIE